MAKIELDISKLAGYTIVESDKQRVGKLGSTKLGVKQTLVDSADASPLPKAEFTVSERSARA